MSDLALSFRHMAADLMIANNDLVLDDGFESAINISVFSHLRAAESDTLPFPTSDRGGYWGDATLGSLLWLLARARQIPATAERAKQYVSASLAWLLADRIAAALEVQVDISVPKVLAIVVHVTRPNGARETYRFARSWDAQASKPSVPVELP